MLRNSARIEQHENIAPVWLTVQEAADRKKVSVWTIRRYIAAGLINAERVGPRLIRVSAASLDNMGRSLQYVEGGE